MSCACLTNSWFCGRLILGDGGVQQLPTGVMGPRLTLTDGNTWPAIARDEINAWLDIKGAFLSDDGIYQHKDPTERAKNLAATREILLVKRSRRVHEQLWTTIFGLIGDVYNDVGAGVALPQEERLFLAIINSARMLGDDWPSSLRNVVNYRPGFAYTAPRFRSGIDSFSYLSAQGQTIDGLIDRLENNNIVMRAAPSVEAQPKVAARMLVDLTILISRIAHALHDEIVDRSGVDRRWLASKNRFSQQRGLLVAGTPWPC